MFSYKVNRNFFINRGKLKTADIDIKSEPGIMTVEETAEYFRKSTSWVYKNWKVLGGRKLGGSLFFPNKEDLYESIFQKRKGVEIRLHPERNQAIKSLVQNKNRSEKSRSRGKKGGVKPGTPNDNRPDPNRHGIFGVNQ